MSAFPPSVDRPGYNWITQKQVNAAAGVGVIQFLTCNATAVSGWPVDQIGGANDSLVEDPRYYAMTYEWQPIPGEASRFKAVAASATVFFR